MLGFPIRTSADQRPVDGSPQLFAVTHVLHRFLAPRHPPLALCSLEEQRCSCLLCSSQRAAHGVHQPSRDRVGATTFTLDRNGSGRRGSGARELVPCAEEEPDPVRAGSLKTEEKTMSADVATRGGRILRHSLRRRPTRQCTNWELVRTGPDKCRPTVERCSLERR